MNDDLHETDTSGVNRDRFTSPPYRDLLRMRRPSEVFCIGDAGLPPEGPDRPGDGARPSPPGRV